MAKKKRRKRKKSMKRGLKFELLGLLFIALAIFSSGISAIGAGFIPRGLEHLLRLFFGIWFVIPSIFLFGLGISIMVKRKWPQFFQTKLVGGYIIFSSLLLFTHVQTFEPIMASAAEPSILKTTWSHFTGYLSGDLEAAYLGGGLIGASFYAFSFYLFSPGGARILSVFGFLIGILFLTQISLGDVLKKIYEKTRNKGLEYKQNIQQKWYEHKAAKLEKKAASNEQDTTPEIEMGQAGQASPNLVENEAEPIIEDFTDAVYHTHDFNEPDPGDAQEEKTNSKPEKTKSVKDTSESQDDQTELDESLPLAEKENIEYILPSPDLLAEPVQNSQQQEKSHIQATVRKLERTFESFGVKARVSKVHVGPSVTKYEVYPSAGVKVSKIVNLHDDLALALAAKDLRIEAPIPGKSAIGIEVPNQEIAMVSLKEVMDAYPKDSPSKLLFGLGRDISGEVITAELNKMPHMLIAGATGSGKSVCVNGIITSILMRAKPHEVKMMMIDPKKVELNVYNGIPHLLTPVVTDPKKASRALKKVVAEMERRYDLFSETGTRNIEGYNEYVKRMNSINSEEEEQPLLPYIVVLVDELSDLMMVASSEVEDAITRLAQMARAAGIHLIIATQRPSVDVITGVIKANIPSRIAFSVSSQTDSRTILDSGGAEKLLGRGDMLFIPVGASKPTRIQGAFLSDEEVERIVDHCVEQQKAQYQEDMIPEEESEVVQEVDDELYDDAVQLVLEMQSASVSMLQRRFRIGYTRAARLIDAMEDRGIVGPYEGSKPRKVLASNVEEEQTS
ncbi:DNA segregation ATPase FtsK/SpoIIIE, S-DNA-T family [Salinibacillus kushneri]|uniref:DNA segregation ATPase FtsK/SpoIIIE, S-DNA-T family n=1 Tax=Salinibacillus kushneri TaxID=237682 RepID=A0A1I0E4M5_9BACI|nr:DNA translocase FtsK [Salinibacillus kushneri]SET39833.1 DNA segregation ATPase FtsK/SpoIIIE, S-DNA-T family [Salinibacillus kushneri]